MFFCLFLFLAVQNHHHCQCSNQSHVLRTIHWTILISCHNKSPPTLDKYLFYLFAVLRFVLILLLWKSALQVLVSCGLNASTLGTIQKWPWPPCCTSPNTKISQDALFGWGKFSRQKENMILFFCFSPNQIYLHCQWKPIQTVFSSRWIIWHMDPCMWGRQENQGLCRGSLTPYSSFWLLVQAPRTHHHLLQGFQNLYGSSWLQVLCPHTHLQALRTHRFLLVFLSVSLPWVAFCLNIRNTVWKEPATREKLRNKQQAWREKIILSGSERKSISLCRKILSLSLSHTHRNIPFRSGLSIDVRFLTKHAN